MIPESIPEEATEPATEAPGKGDFARSDSSRYRPIVAAGQ